MALEKMTITKTKIDGNNLEVSKSPVDRFEVQFNPTTIPSQLLNDMYTKTNIGDNVPEHTFGGGKGQKVSLNLWFDTSFTTGSLFGARPVTTAYEKLSKWSLITPPETQIPFLFIQWGSSWEFVGQIESLNEEFTLFMPDGLPLRALVKVCFLQTVRTDGTGKLVGTNPTSRSYARKTWIVEHGQRLDWIAHQEYGDSSAWRHIAEVNALDNPQSIYPGQILKLTPR